MAIKPKKVPAVKKPTIDDVYGGAPAAEPASPAAEAAPEPAPVPEAIPEPATTEKTMPAPTTAPEPTEPEPVKAEAAPAEAAPEPAPQPALEPAPEPAATPEPPLAPEPAAEAAAAPTPEPEPVPEPQPAPEPEPGKATESEKAPESTPAEVSVAVPAAEAAPAPVAAPVVATSVAPPPPMARPQAPRRRPVLYAVTAFSLLLSAATTTAVATLPLWQGELDRVWERTDAAAAGTFLIAAQGVSRAAAGSAPFGAAVEIARALAPAGQAPIAAALDRVAAFADKGAPAVPALRARFETVATAIRDGGPPRPATPARATPDWAPEWVERSVNQITAALPVDDIRNAGLFGAPAPAPTPPALRNAEVLLTAGNLREAVASVRSLGSAPVALASAWLADAQRRIDLDDAARTLERLALEHQRVAAAQPSLEERLDRLVKAAERHLFE